MGAIVIGGANFVAVAISNEGLPPFWGAALRFGLAALLMAGIVLVAKIAFPRGKALVGATLYGAIAFGGAYASAYYSLQFLPAGMLSIMLALSPLLTAFLAPLHGLERLRLPVVVGGVLAVAGVALVLREQATLDAPVSALLASVLFALCAAESSVVVKQFPRAHPLATNAVGMASGAVVLVVASLVARETWLLPSTFRVAGAVAYLIVVGSILLFLLFLYTLARLPVTSTVFQFALMPLVTVVLAALLLDQPVTWALAVGAVLVIVGVYVGIGRKQKVAEPEAVA